MSRSSRGSATGRGDSRESSASRREALEMSVIRRSSRPTSCFRIACSRSRPAPSPTSSSVSTADRIEVSGLRISCATSAAKRSIASIRSESVWVMSSSERARSPSSSLRSAMSGRAMARARFSRTLSAAADSRRTGWAINWVRANDESRLTATAMAMNGICAARSAAMIWSTSLASSVSTPSTSRTRWIGIETETTRPPFSATRTPATVWPLSAVWISLSSACSAAAASCGFGSKPGKAKGFSPGFSAGGSCVDSTRSATTQESEIECPSASNRRTRSVLGIDRLSRKSLATSACSSGAGSVAFFSITLASSWPSVLSDWMRAVTRPWRSSFSSRAPPTRMARPARLRTMISRPIREGGVAARGRLARSDLAVAVTDTIEGFDGVELRVNLPELLAHAFDVAVDRPVVDINLIVVGRVHQVVAALHEAGALGQRLQQQELGHRQPHRPVVPQAVVAGRIEGQAAALDRLDPVGGGLGGFGLGVLGPGATQHRLHPLQQQALAERLVDVVVGAEVEAQDLVDLLVLRGQHDHRQGGGLAQAAQHLHAVHPRHLHVEDGEVGRVALERRQTGRAVVAGLYRMAVAFQGQGDRRNDVLVVIHKSDLRHGLLLQLSFARPNARALQFAPERRENGWAAAAARDFSIPLKRQAMGRRSSWRQL